MRRTEVQQNAARAAAQACRTHRAAASILAPYRSRSIRAPQAASFCSTAS